MKLITLLPLLALLSGRAAGAVPNSAFAVFDLPYTGRFAHYLADDLNRDGRQDMLIFTTRPTLAGSESRWLYLYLQTPAGFPATPTQVLLLPDDLILYDTGDVTGDANRELVYFTRSGLKYFRLGPAGFSRKPEKLLRAESIYRISDKKTVRRWDFVRDLNEDGRDDLIVPQITRTVIYWHGAGRAWQSDTLALSTESRVFGYYDPRFSVGHKSDAVYSTPYILFADFNLDGRKDLLGVYNDSLVVHEQTVAGRFDPGSHQVVRLHFGDVWRGAKIQRTHLEDRSERQYLMRIKDINHDGILDIVSTKVSTKHSLLNPRSEVRIYFGRRAGDHASPPTRFPKTPDQIIHPGGTIMVLDIIDVNFDQRDDLIIPVVNIGITQIMKMLLTKTVGIEAEHYRMRADGLYPEKPDLKNRLNVKFSFKGGAASPVYEIADCNGDGAYDFVSSNEEKRLLIYYGNKKGDIKNSVGKKFNIPLPQDGTRVHAQDVNGDRKSDVIIVYSDDDIERKKLKYAIRVLIAN